MLVVVWIQSSACAQQVTQESASSKGVAKDYNFAAGHSSLGIPLEEDDGYIFLQLRINNSGPLWFGLDTGATRTLIDRRVADSLNLKPDGNQQIGGAGGLAEAAILRNVSIKLPGAEIHNQTLWSIPLDALAAANGRKMAGILGYELFKYFVVDIDYAAKVMNLYEPSRYQYRGRGQSIPLNVQDDGEIYVQASVQAAGGTPIEGEFVIDTGGSRTLLLAKSFVEEHQLLKSVEKTLLVRGGGVGGEIQLVMGRLKTLRVGQYEIANPVVGFTKVGQIADANKAGNISAGFLKRFRVIFDYGRKQMILEPTKRLTEPDEFDMSGAALMSEGPDYTVIKVVRVRPDSAAAIAGLLAEDVIIAVDDQPSTNLNVNRLKEMFRVERDYVLKVKRKDQIVHVKIKLKRLI